MNEHFDATSSVAASSWLNERQSVEFGAGSAGHGDTDIVKAGERVSDVEQSLVGE
jgi:hypothetical protein